MKPFAETRRAIYQLLARRDYSQQELRLKLLQKGQAEPDVIAVIREFVQAGLVCDKRFTALFIRSRQQKGYGPKRIKHSLKDRGISEDIIAEQLDITDNAWVIAAKKIWQKHFKNKMPEGYTEKVKQMRYLYARGYTNEQIEEVFD